METSKKQNWSTIAGTAYRWLVIAGCVVFALWLLSSCEAETTRRNDEHDREIYNEAFNEGYSAGWYDGQEALIDYVQHDWDWNDTLEPRDR